MNVSWKGALVVLAVLGTAGWSAIASEENAPSEDPGAASPAVAPNQEAIIARVAEPRFAVVQEEAAANGSERPLAARVFAYTQGEAPADNVRLVEVEGVAAGTAAGEFWIGVQLEPLPELITSQLKLERGMVVVEVFDDSPAAKAEFKRNDIILRAGEKDVKGPDDLISAVNDSKDQELTVTVLRSGTETTLKVTPQKRSPQQVEVRWPQVRDEVIVQKLDDLYRRNPDGEVRLLAVRPGAVYAYSPAVNLPDDLQIVIEKQGDKPAKIRVTKVKEGDDQTWEVTADKLDELPDEIRAHVRNMMGGLGHVHHVLRRHLTQSTAKAYELAVKPLERSGERATQSLGEYRLRLEAVPAGPRAAPPPVAPAMPQVRGLPAGGGIEAKLDAILRKLDGDQAKGIQRLEEELEKLRKEVEALRQEKK